MLRQICWIFTALVLTSCAGLRNDQQDALNTRTMLSGATLTPLQEAYDVRHYQLRLTVHPESEEIAGTLSVRLTALSSLEVVELDLDPRFALGAAFMGDEAIRVERADDKVRLHLPEALAADETVTVSLSYEGRPYVAENAPWDGGFVWSETDDGSPWIATAVQGRGCDLWWPCKDFHGDKPDEGVDLIVTVPTPLVAAMNGVLIQESHNEGKSTYHWRSPSPHTGYAVALNVGPYTLIEDTFESRDGSKLPISFYALPENAEKARELIATDAKPHLAFFEERVGPYPWRDEKVGFVETPHLGMEHQTINAYGWGYETNAYGFDWLLHHELAHEWFGNAMTHAMPEDVWLHEGYAMYMQPLYAEATLGEVGYQRYMNELYLKIENCAPTVVPGAAHIDAAIGNGDVYNKGAWMLHTLRWLVGEDALWRATRRLIYGTATPWDGYGELPGYRSTADFIALLSEEAGRDLGPIVSAYLYRAELPRLAVQEVEGEVRLTWENVGPHAFDVPVPVQVGGESLVVVMENGTGSFALPEAAEFKIDPEARILRDLPVLKPCDIKG